jgi:nicotinamidase-related amidase
LAKTVNSVSVYSSLEEILDPAHTALLVIDMQNDFCDERGWWSQQGRSVASIQAIIPRVQALIGAARQAGCAVIFVEQVTLPDNQSDPPGWLYFKTRDGRQRTDYALEGSWGQQTVAEMGRLPSEVLVRKHRPSAFHLTNLDLVLQARGVKSVLITGTVTQGCVLSTAYDASFHNYYTVVVGDSVATHSPDLHATALKLLAARYDFVEATQVVELWGRELPNVEGPDRPNMEPRQ